MFRIGDILAKRMGGPSSSSTGRLSRSARREMIALFYAGCFRRDSTWFRASERSARASERSARASELNMAARQCQAVLLLFGLATLFNWWMGPDQISAGDVGI